MKILHLDSGREMRGGQWQVLRLHRGDVPPEDREIIFGVPVTNAMRTILDVWTEGSLPRPDLREAFREAVKHGAITKTQIANCQKDSQRAPVLGEIRKGNK